MSTIENQLIDQEEEDMSEVTLYLIKDDLPKAVVRDIANEIDKIRGVKNYLDFGAFIQIEFVNKADANIARADMFKYKVNGQDQKRPYATATRVTNYSRELCPANVGKGF
ncbi:hypothetical protein HA402_015569 [Bradysia odoriphaga]|nr:hypothetical protein HA402_015569 [Bradysia odoriphaga]